MRTLLLATTLILASCGADKRSEPDPPPTYQLVDDVPKCTTEARGLFVYVAQNKNYYVCSSTGWITTRERGQRYKDAGIVGDVY